MAKEGIQKPKFTFVLCTENKEINIYTHFSVTEQKSQIVIFEKADQQKQNFLCNHQIFCSSLIYIRT